MSLANIWTLIIFALAIITAIKYKTWWLWPASVGAMVIGLTFGHSIGAIAALIIGLIIPPVIKIGIKWATKVDAEKVVQDYKRDHPEFEEAMRKQKGGPNTSY